MARGSLHKHTLHKSNKLLRAQIEKPTLDFLSNVAWKVQKEWQNRGYSIYQGIFGKNILMQIVKMSVNEHSRKIYYDIGLASPLKHKIDEQTIKCKSAATKLYYVNVNRNEKSMQHENHENMAINFFERRSLFSTSNVNPNLSWFFVSL